MELKWNKTYSESFPLHNSVKQGNCLGPILFTIYIYGLLERLKNAAINYCAFGYVDDIALIVPSLYSLKQIIIICEKYFEEFCIMSNPSKYKLLCYNMLTSVAPNVMLCGEVIDVVYFEKCLGNKMYNIYKHDMEVLIGDFYLCSKLNLICVIL